MKVPKDLCLAEKGRVTRPWIVERPHWNVPETTVVQISIDKNLQRAPAAGSMLGQSISDVAIRVHYGPGRTEVGGGNDKTSLSYSNEAKWRKPCSKRAEPRKWLCSFWKAEFAERRYSGRSLML